MPVDDYACTRWPGSCGRIQRDVLHAPEELVLCKCWRPMKRLVSMPVIHWAPGVHPKHEDSVRGAARQLESPEVQAGLKSGRLAIKKATDSREGPAASSDIQTRLAEGTLKWQ